MLDVLVHPLFVSHSFAFLFGALFVFFVSLLKG